MHGSWNVVRFPHEYERWRGHEGDSWIPPASRSSSSLQYLIILLSSHRTSTKFILYLLDRTIYTVSSSPVGWKTPVILKRYVKCKRGRIIITSFRRLKNCRLDDLIDCSVKISSSYVHRPMCRKRRCTAMPNGELEMLQMMTLLKKRGVAQGRVQEPAYLTQDHG